MSDDAERPFDAGDEKQVRKRRRDVGLREREEGGAVQTLLASRNGRAWFYSLLEQCHVFHSSFTADPYQTAFNEGERNVGLRLVATLMQFCPHRYSEMMQEANDERSRPTARKPAEPASAINA